MVGVYPVGTLVILDSKELGLVCESNSAFVKRPRIFIIADSKGNQVEAFPADLSEKNTHGDFKRTIIKTLDADKWGVNIAEYLL
jgi:hypothetical protein